jgi:hypothetical protein
MRYWLDADVFINNHNTHYPIGIANKFWLWMDRVIADDILVSPKRVFDEVVKNRKADDPLLLWMHRHKSDGLCIKPTRAVDQTVTEIGDWVFGNPQYPNHQRLEFGKGGDPWLIAAAKHDKGTVVSNESKHFPRAQKVRIPDVCHHFRIRVISMDDLIREIPADF